MAKVKHHKKRVKLTKGNPVVARAAKVLLKHGYTKTGAAGVIGNALQESGWSPGSVGSGGGGLWGFTASPNSLADLQSFAAKHHKSWDRTGVQTRFLLHHVPSSVKAAVNNAKSPEEAAAIFMSQWERPYVPTENLANRQKGAKEAFAQIKGAKVSQGKFKRKDKNKNEKQPKIKPMPFNPTVTPSVSPRAARIVKAQANITDLRQQLTSPPDYVGAKVHKMPKTKLRQVSGL